MLLSCSNSLCSFALHSCLSFHMQRHFASHLSVYSHKVLQVKGFSFFLLKLVLCKHLFIYIYIYQVCMSLVRHAYLIDINKLNMDIKFTFTAKRTLQSWLILKDILGIIFQACHLDVSSFAYAFALTKIGILT